VRTGRVITAAAAVMVVVFASFIAGGNRTIEMFGLALAAAVFLTRSSSASSSYPQPCKSSANTPGGSQLGSTDAYHASPSNPPNNQPRS